MKSTFLKSMMAVLMALFSINAHAYDAYVNGIYYNLYSYSSTAKATVTYKTYGSGDYSGKVSIPSSISYNGKVYNVTAIGYDAFYNCSGLTSVNIPNSVTSIGSEAFANCDKLTHVEINSHSIVSVDRQSTSSLGAIFGFQVTEYVIGKDVKRIGGNAFFSNKNLSSVTIEDGVTAIGYDAFYNCSGLTSVNIPNSVTTIEWGAFCNCGLINSFEIPNSVTTIEHDAFHNCTSLTSVNIPSSISSLSEYIFENCKSLTTINIPTNITSIERAAFRGCSGLLSMDIPNSVTSIGEYAFGNCSGLLSMDIPNSVTSIGEHAFSECSGLLSMDIPNSVTSIGKYAFSGCSGLISLIIPGTFKLGDLFETASYYKYPESLSLSVTGNTIVKEAYKGCSYITSVTIPSTVYSFGADAFSGCKGIKNVVIPNNRKVQNIFPTYQNISNITFTYSTSSMSDEICSGCTGLTSVTIPSSVTSLGNSSFKDCSSLTSIKIPSTVNSIGRNSFDGCESLSKVEISDLSAWLNVSFLSESANPLSVAHHLYLNGTELRNLVIPDGVTAIGNYAFYGCESFITAEFPSTMKQIGYCGFAGCSNLETIDFTNQSVTFDTNAFGECTGLTRVNITDLAAWCNSSFSNANSNPLRSAHHLFMHGTEIQNLSIPSGVMKIPDYAFYNCKVLKSLMLPETCETIGYNAFYGCEGLLDLNLPNGCQAIYNKAFDGCIAIKSIKSNAENPPAIYTETFLPDIYNDATVYVSSAALETYKSTPRWSSFNNIVAQGAIDNKAVAIFEDVDFYQNSAEKEYETITYTRTFNNTNWQSLYVPFSMSYNDWKDEFDVARINAFYEYDTDNDGTIDKQVLEVLPVKEGNGDLRPNYPYMIKAKTTGKKTITLVDATLYATEENYVDCSTVETKYTFTGTYQKMNGLKSAGYYFMSGGGLKTAPSDDTNLGAFRWYLKAENKGSTLIQPTAEINIRVVGEDEVVTGIEQVEMNRPTEQKVYSIDGRLVSTNGTEGLKSGIYIVNGKKVVVQ